MGVLFEVHRSIGNELQEKYYHRAISERLTEENIPFVNEYYLPISDQDNKVGKQFIDFVMDEKIALEVKATPTIKGSDFRQLIAYLDQAKLKLGILANFRTSRLTYKRIVNARVKLIEDRE